MRLAIPLSLLPLVLVSIGCCLPIPFDAPADDPGAAPPVQAGASGPATPPTSSAPTPAAPPPATPAFETLPAGAWAGGPPRLAGAMRASDRRVPQVDGLRALFESSRTPREGTLEDALLVCAARVHGGGFDDGVFAGGADVALAARFGGSSIRSTDQTSARLYSFPVSRLARGDALWLRVIDRDAFFDDTIAEGSARFARAPFTLTMGQADVECRAVDPARVGRRADRALAALDRALDGLERARPDVQAPGLGYPSARAGRATVAARRARAWIDASHEAYLRRVDRAEAIDESWERRATAAVRDAADRLPAPGVDAPIGRARRVRVERVACGMDASELAAQMQDVATGAGASGCLVVLSLAARQATTVAPTARADARWAVWGIDDGAATHPARLVARRRGEAWLDPAASATVPAGARIELVLALPAGADPTLLRVREGGRPALLRLR